MIFFPLPAPFSFSKCKACTAAVNVRDRPVPRAKKNSHQYLENIMVPAIMSLWNQERWIHLAINNFIPKANICACNASLCSLRINCSTKGNLWHSIVYEVETRRSSQQQKEVGYFSTDLTKKPVICVLTFLISTVVFWESEIGKSLVVCGVFYKRLPKARQQGNGSIWRTHCGFSCWWLLIPLILFLELHFPFSATCTISPVCLERRSTAEMAVCLCLHALGF